MMELERGTDGLGLIPLNWGRFESGGEHGAALGVRAGLRQ